MIGQTISHYRITEKLGEGGMGVVYKAEDTRLKRFVALKFLRSDVLEDEEHRERFLREAQAAAALDHPNICTVYEIDEAEGQTFLSMAFLEGQTVKEKFKERPLKLDEALDIAIQTAQGLQAAHEKGIVHRDIKSSNLMVTPQGQVKVMDFGLAQLADRSKLTKTTASLGTPSYMSPEQAQKSKTDRRTDIWSLGVVVYEMVTGRLPFEREREQAVLYSIVNEEPEVMTAQRVDVPVELDRIVEKALAKSPDERYQHVEEMIVDLNSLSKKLASGKSTILRPQVPDTATSGASVGAQRAAPQRSPRMLLAGMSVALAVAVAVIVWQALQSRELALEPTPIPTYKRLTFRRGTVIQLSVLSRSVWERENDPRGCRRCWTTASVPPDEAAASVVTASWPAGFYDLEANGGQEWRWCGRRGTLLLLNLSGLKKEIEIDMLLRAGQDGGSNLRIESLILSEDIRITPAGTKFSRALTVEPGENPIVFECDGAPLGAPNDPRELVFRIDDFRIRMLGGDPK